MRQHGELAGSAPHGPTSSTLNDVGKDGPAQMLRINGFGSAGSTIAETTGLAKVYREHLEARIRKNSYVQQIARKLPSS